MGLNSISSATSGGPGVLDSRMSLDVQGVDELRRTVRTSPEEGMKQASKQFEVLFLQMMLKNMRQATPSESMFGSESEKMYTGMLDQQLTQKMAGHGLGLADAMFAQLKRSMASEAFPSESTGATPAATPTPMSLLPADGKGMSLLTPAMKLPQNEQSKPVVRLHDMSLYGLTQSKTTPSHIEGTAIPSAAERVDPESGLTQYESTTAQANFSRSVLPQAHVEAFVSKMLPAAQRASEASGVPAQLIMAQAALESGWGKREIRGPDGKTSFNVFGIKADKSWKGDVVQSNTTEFVNGVAKKTTATFRAYKSYDAAFSDYANFMSTNQRYSEVVNTKDPHAAAHGLQRVGYATDPQYSGKLISIMNKMVQPTT